MKYPDAIRMSVTITRPSYEYLKELALAEHRSISAQLRALVDAEHRRRSVHEVTPTPHSD